MKILIVANLAVMVLCWVLVIIVGLSAGAEFKKRHPEFVRERASFKDKVLNIIRFTSVAICPILNIYEAYVLLFRTDDVIIAIIEGAEETYAATAYTK